MPRFIGVNRQINSQEVLDGTLEQIDLSTALLNQLIPLGSVIPYAGDADTGNWMVCDGRPVSRTTYAALFALIGTRFGQGDNSTTFNIPDTRGLFLRGRDGGAGRDPNSGSRTNLLLGGASGNNVGSFQSHAFQDHNHLFQWGQGAGAVNPISSPTVGNSISDFNRVLQRSNQVAGATTGNAAGETRPINLYMNYLIRVL